MQKTRDVNGKVIFQDPILCSQFLRDYSDIPILKNVKPEDIQDCTERFQTILGTEFEADTVKQVNLQNGTEEDCLFLISLIEHKSHVDYNVIMQLLKYMICIWTEYAKEMERKKPGSSRNKNFRYPPILPIVYYEGAGTWTADLYLKDRIFMNEIFGEYIPDFSYRLVRIHDYSNDELLSREDEMSLVMMINKVQTETDFKEFLDSQNTKINQIVQKAPERVLQIIADTIWTLCMKMNVPAEEAKQCVKKVRVRQMGYLFENMEKMDIQAERRKTKEAQKKLEETKDKLEEAQDKLVETQKAIVELCQKLGGNKQDAIKTLVEKLEIDRIEAEGIANTYWKE